MKTLKRRIEHLESAARDSSEDMLVSLNGAAAWMRSNGLRPNSRQPIERAALMGELPYRRVVSSRSMIFTTSDLRAFAKRWQENSTQSPLNRKK